MERRCFLCHTIIGHVRRIRGFTRRRWEGNDPCLATNDHAVYVHYDRQGIVSDYVVEQVRQLASAGFRVTFVSNAPRLSDMAVSRVRPFCREMIWRHNIGYDFGAYKDGIRAIGNLKNCGRLLLMNDSIYGPFWPLGNVLQTFDSSQSDMWGITDSWDGHYHIQSYFVLFSRRAVTSKSFRKFWRRFPYVNDRAWIVHYGEIKLTQRLIRSGLRAAVLCPYWDVAKSVLAKLESLGWSDLTEGQQAFLKHLHNNIQFGRPLNSMHYFWDTLIAEFGCPFMKRELLQKNPEGVIYTWRWSELLSRKSNYNLALIHRDLQAQ
jgi:lipopolysaccharide biosynthesis protein